MLPNNRTPQRNTRTFNEQLHTIVRFITDHFGWLLLAGLALAAVISVVAPGLTTFIQANLAACIIGGIVIGMGIGTGAMYILRWRQ